MSKSRSLQPLGFRFLPALFVVDDQSYKGAFRTDPVGALYDLGFGVRPVAAVDEAGLFLWRVADSFLRELVRTDGLELSRWDTVVSLSDDVIGDLLASVPFAPGCENVSGEWLRGLWAGLQDCFSREMREYPGSVALYLAEKDGKLKVAERIFFHLVENRQDDRHPFSFLATYSTRDGNGGIRHASLKYALTEYKGQRDKILELLACLNRASEVSPLIGEFTASGEMFHPLRLTAREAWMLLRDVPAIEETGIVCRIPDWWRKSRQRARVGVSLTRRESLLGLDSILRMDGYLEVDGERLTEDEAKRLLSMEEGLSLIKGKWVEVDHERLQTLLDEMERLHGDISMMDAIRRGLASAGAETEEFDRYGVSNSVWISELLRNLRSLSPDSAGDRLCLPASFKAQLRPYQRKGCEWLARMLRCDFGACLADDMGLGKTVQVLALLETLRQEEPEARVLLVVPASLLGNWQKECRRFVPLLPVQVLHPSAGKAAVVGKTAVAGKAAVVGKTAVAGTAGSGGGEAASGHGEAVPGASFLSITTYSMVTRMDVLAQVEWSLLILDEAQAIKNPSSKQTRAIKSLRARRRIALTGTPIENELTNLWSLFDFLNKGLLGTAAEFRRFAASLKENPSGYSRLKAMISPFMLRRLKTDKAIISDLPEKLEMTDYVSLSKKQRALYKKYVDDLARQLEREQFEERSMRRRGLVLASLSKLKQICNHPDQFTGAGGFAEGDSGKFQLLGELCRTIYEKRERVLVFTQFKEICPVLDTFLAGVFGCRGFVLHGGTSVQRRGKMVEEFQGDRYIPYMVISVKAGGTGLNLTKANHVVHFDRWWNPAVENQATDRAFRIGQSKDVMVHKLVCQGTVEEKIDQLIRSKTELAQNVIAADSGESWITEMSDGELLGMFQLEGEVR